MEPARKERSLTVSLLRLQRRKLKRPYGLTLRIIINAYKLLTEYGLNESFIADNMLKIFEVLSQVVTKL